MGMSSSEVVVHKTTSRRNGWSWPPHPFQVIAWVVIVYLASFLYLTTAPSLISPLEYANYAVFSVIFIVHLTVHLLACSINPADEKVLQKLKLGRKEVATFDRTKHRHVIENCHCYICEVDVSKRSKHCSACNKCVAIFDHHCKWLNNCVGRRNYNLFLATLVTAASGALWLAIFSLMAFISYFTDRGSGQVLRSYSDGLSKQSSSTTFNSGSPNNTSAEFQFKLYYAVVPDPAWLVIVMATVVLALLAVGLLGHLFGFHVYLMRKNLTTYDYIVRQRELDEKAARQAAQVDYSEGGSETAHPKKSNKVLPERGSPSSPGDTNTTYDISNEKLTETTSTTASPTTGGHISNNGSGIAVSLSRGNPSLSKKKRKSFPADARGSKTSRADQDDSLSRSSDVILIESDRPRY